MKKIAMGLYEGKANDIVVTKKPNKGILLWSLLF